MTRSAKSPYSDPSDLGPMMSPPLKSRSETHRQYSISSTPKPETGGTAKSRGRARSLPRRDSVTASAARLTKNTSAVRTGDSSSWQDDAWEMYDLVGEERFLATTLAGRLSQARLYVGERSDTAGSAPVEVEERALQETLEALGSSQADRAQMIYRLGINLFVAGEGWMVGVPREILKQHEAGEMSGDDVLDSFGIIPDPTSINEEETDGFPVTDMEWSVLSNDELTFDKDNNVTLHIGDAYDTPLKIKQDQVFIVRIWRPHPRKWWEADSPTRSSLSVLRELVGLTMHISAQVDSRLAGAGLLVVPESARRSIQEAAGIDEDSNEDPLIDSLMEAMLTPISDRSSASAVVPLLLTVPDEAADKFQHISFASPLDAEARELREEAIRRLALGQDAPPELLLGTSGMNHWGAWLVREDVVTTHIEPPLALICDALTSQYLWPLLIDQGYTEEKARKYTIWYDVEHMVVRPNRSDSALQLYKEGVVSAEALRDSSGFDTDDAPDIANNDQAAQRTLQLIEDKPELLMSVGAAQLLETVRAIMNGGDIPEPVRPTSTPESEQEAPDEDTEEEPDEDTNGNSSPETGSGPGRVPAKSGGGETPTE